MKESNILVERYEQGEDNLSFHMIESKISFLLGNCLLNKNIGLLEACKKQLEEKNKGFLNCSNNPIALLKKLQLISYVIICLTLFNPLSRAVSQDLRSINLMIIS